jgi:hypothetical protein
MSLDKLIKTLVTTTSTALQSEKLDLDPPIEVHVIEFKRETCPISFTQQLVVYYNDEKTKIRFNVDLARDIQSQFSLDLGDELTAILADELAQEKNLQRTDNLLSATFEAVRTIQ